MPGAANIRESYVSCDRAGGQYFPLRKRVGDRRNASIAKALGLAISAGTLLLIGSNTIAQAATLEEVARCRAIQISSERWQCFKSLKSPNRSAPKAKSEGAPPPVEETVRDDPVATSSINRLRAASGQPLCIDQDSLAAALIAGVLASSPAEATTNGCQTIPEDAEVEVIERFPSSFQFLRVVKVKVTSHTHQPEPSVGYTVEIGR